MFDGGRFKMFLFCNELNKIFTKIYNINEKFAFCNSKRTFFTEVRLNAKLDEKQKGSQESHIIIFSNRSEYDGVNKSSSDDDLVDDSDEEDRFVCVEYTIGALKLGLTAIGVRTPGGVAIAVVKRVTSPLIELAIEIDKHWFFYDATSFESCAQAASSLALQLSQNTDSGSKESNAAILFAGINADNPQLWYMDPEGTYVQSDVKVIGAGSESAQQILQESYTLNMTIQEAVKLSLRTLKKVMKVKLDSTNVEVMIATPQRLFKLYAKEELQKCIEDLI